MNTEISHAVLSSDPAADAATLLLPRNNIRFLAEKIPTAIRQWGVLGVCRSE